MLSSTNPTLSAIMVSQRPSSLMEDLSLLLVFGSNYMSVWAPISSEAHPTDGQMERINQIIEDMIRDCVRTDGPNGTSTFH
jgi:hypothetical protein